MSEHLEAMEQYIKEVVALAVKAERERIATLIEEYRDYTPFLKLADVIRAEPSDSDRIDAHIARGSDGH